MSIISIMVICNNNSSLASTPSAITSYATIASSTTGAITFITIFTLRSVAITTSSATATTAIISS